MPILLVQEPHFENHCCKQRPQHTCQQGSSDLDDSGHLYGNPGSTVIIPCLLFQLWLLYFLKGTWARWSPNALNSFSVGKQMPQQTHKWVFKHKHVPQRTNSSARDIFSSENHCYRSDQCEDCKVIVGENHTPPFNGSRNKGQEMLA